VAVQPRRAHREHPHPPGTDADVADQQPFRARLDDLAGVLTATSGERVVLVAPHAPFDVGVLHLEHQRAGRALPDVEVLDTLALARHLKLGTGRYRLPDVLAHFGLTVTDHHNALADAADTARALARLLHAAARGGHTHLGALLAAAQPDRPRASGYPARPAARSTRAGAGSPFTFIDRPPPTTPRTRSCQSSPPTATWAAGWRGCASASRCAAHC
jgi:DNA polymerase III epsilon subunit-like protein